MLSFRKTYNPICTYNLQLAGYSLLEQVHDFKFLGSCKSADGDCTKEIKRRIALARQKAVVLTSIWKDRNIKMQRKSK